MSFSLVWVHSVLSSLRSHWVETQFNEVAACGWPVWLQREGVKGRVHKRLRESEKTIGILESPPCPTDLGDLPPLSVSVKSLICIWQDFQSKSYSLASPDWRHCSTGDTRNLISLCSDKTVQCFCLPESLCLLIKFLIVCQFMFCFVLLLSSNRVLLCCQL